MSPSERKTFIFPPAKKTQKNWQHEASAASSRKLLDGESRRDWPFVARSSLVSTERESSFRRGGELAEPWVLVRILESEQFPKTGRVISSKCQNTISIFKSVKVAWCAPFMPRSEEKATGNFLKAIRSQHRFPPQKKIESRKMRVSNQSLPSALLLLLAFSVSVQGRPRGTVRRNNARNNFRD